MDKISKLLLLHMPGSACNLRCEYCYITNQHLWDKELKTLAFQPDQIVKALTKERVGGTAIINFCASGETLLSEYSIEIIRGLLENGHYLEVVTNGTLTKRFDSILQFPADLLRHLTFKFSFHYAELKRCNLLDVYFDNVMKMHRAGCSFTVEMTPWDSIMDQKEDIKQICLSKMGALCQMTIARDDVKAGIPVMSKLGIDEYYNFWKEFNSTMFDFKRSIFGVKRTEFCYAGLFSINIDLSTGNYFKCYSAPVYGNIFENMDKPLKFEAIGKCPVAHCYNGHAHMALGLIPELKAPTYAIIRNIKIFGSEDSIKDDIWNVYSQRITDNNVLLTKQEQATIYRKENRKQAMNKHRKQVRRFLSKIKHQLVRK